MSRNYEQFYGSVDFKLIDTYLREHFKYVSPPWDNESRGMGRGYIVGVTAADEDLMKIDLYYTDQFIQPVIASGNVRMATIGEIAAMKIDIVQREARKKDFWDIHEILDTCNVEQMIALHEARYPYAHDADAIYSGLTDFRNADDDLDPICLKGKHWELIKLDIVTAVESLKK